MVEEPIVQEEKKEETFFKKFGWLFVIGCGLIAILFLLGTIIKFTQVFPDETEITTKANLIYFFTHKMTYNWTLYVALGLLVVGMGLIAGQKFQSGLGSAASMSFFLVIPMLALEAEFFKYQTDIECLSFATLSWGAICTISFAIIAAVLSLSIEFSDNPIVTRQITEDGILIAAAFILNLIRIYKVPGQGGSINFQMLPLFLIALRHGPAHGLVCGGILYGLITCLTDGYGFASYPFDYLIGFGSVMVLGFFRKFIFGEGQDWYNAKGEIFLLVGCLLATLLRFIGSTASSMVIWGLNLNDAIGYNSVYIPVSGIISMGVIMGAYGPIAKVNKLFPINR